MANNNNDLTVNIKATFDKSNMGDFKSEVTKAVEDAAKSVKSIEIKANTQSARASMQKFTSYLAGLSNAKDGYTTLKIHANIDDAKKQVNELKTVLSAFGKENKVVLDVKADKVYDRLNGIVKLMRQMQFTGNRAIKVEANAQKAIDTLKTLKKEYGDVAKQIKITASIDGATDVINNLKAIQSLLKKIQKDSNINVKAKIDTSSVTKDVEKAKAQTKIQTDNIGTDEAKIARQRQREIENDARITRQLEKEREAALQYEQRVRYALGKKGLSGGISIVDKEDLGNVQKVQQYLTSVTSTMSQLRAEALKAGNALNKAISTQDIEKANKAFNKAIDNLVNYQRATKGLTKNSEGFLIEKLAVGSIKEGTRAYEVLIKRIRDAVQAQKDLNVLTNRRPPYKEPPDPTLSGWFRNMDMGRAVSGMAYAARGELNFVQSFGNLLSSLSKVDGVVGQLTKLAGGITIAGLAITGAINIVTGAFNQLTNVLGQVGNAIYRMLQPGIELYKSRETAELSIAAAISARATEGGKDIPYERAMEYAQTLMERVVKDAAVSAFNPQDLIDALRGTLPLALGKGLNVEQSYELTKGVASVAKVTRLASNQVLQELRDILQGTISAKSSQVAGATGITGEGLREADAQGELYEYIIDHMKTFTFALNRYSYTLSGALDRLSESWAMGMERVFTAIEPQVNGLINYVIDNFVGGIYENIGTKDNPIKGRQLKTQDEIKEATNAEFFNADWMNDFAKALKDLMKFLGPVIDDVLAFLKELTGTDNVVAAVTESIKYAISVTVALGKILLIVFKSTMDMLIELEAPISLLMSALLKTGQQLTSFGSILMDLATLAYDGAKILASAIKLIATGGEQGGETAWESMKNAGETMLKLKEDLDKFEKSKFTKLEGWETTYEGVFGTDIKSLQNKAGAVTKIFEEISEAKAPPKKTDVDLAGAQGKRTEENKQNLADLRKAMQEAIEKIKQELKEALAKLKDIAEQNELAYRQGYKSIEDYFSQKAQLEYEEALLKVAALQREIEEVQKLNTGGDAGAQYQKERDLVRLNGELNIEQRNLNKKADQTNELLGAIAHNTAINSYQQGLGYNNVSFSRANASSAISAYGSEVSSILTNSLNNQDMINFESAMQHGTEGCVEFADRFLAQFDNFFKEMLDSGVFDTDVLIEHAREAGMQIQDATEEAIRAVQAGDIIFADTGTGFKNGHTLVVLSNNNGAIQVAANASSTYDNANGSYMLNSGEEHIRTYDLDSYLGDSYSASTIIKSGEKIAQSLNLMENASEQFAQDVRESTNRVEQIRQDIDNSYKDISARMPRAYSPRVEEYQKAVQDGQTRWLEALSKYNGMMNDNASMLIAVEASVAATAVKLKREAQIFGTQFANQFPELKETLEKMIPIEVLKVEAKIWEQKANERLQMIEDDAKAVNKKLREKSWLFPQAIEQYMSYFQKIGTKDGAYTITDQLQQMAKVADELAKQGAISEARNISKKIIELRSKFSNMIQSWIDEMGNYFNYRKELVNADSGLPSFVKEERVKQLEKGEARAKAVAYGQEAMEWAKLEVKYQEQLDKVLAHKNEELDKTMSADADILRMNIADLEIAKQRAMRQAEINAKLGEQKTLWQETMDAANQALENGLYNFMTDYINTAESIGEAFRNMAVDILKDLQKFFAKKAITDLMHVIVGEPNPQYNAPDVASIQTSTNTSTMVGQLTQANTYLAQIAGQSAVSGFGNNIGSYGGLPSYGMYGTSTPSVNSGLGMFGYQDYQTYKAMTVSAPGVEASVANSTTQTVAATTGFQNQMVSMLPSLFGSLGGTLVGIINALGSIAGSLGLLYLTYVAIKYILDAVVEIGHAILDAVVEIGHAILDAVVEIGKEFVKLFAYVAGLILDWNTSAVGLARAIFGNSDDDAVEQTDAVTLLSSILSTLSAIYGVNSAIASKLGVDTKDKTEESAEGSEGDSTVTTTTDTNISDSDALMEENKMLVDSIYQRRVLEKLELIVSALNTMLRLNIVGLIMQLISIITMANVGKSFKSFKSTFKNDFGFATGGYISGKGTSTSDSIHAMLSNGEYVIKADAVKKYGLNFLDAVNSGHFTRMRTVIPRFADGGYVGDALQDTARGMTDFAKNLGTSVGVDNTISIALVRDESEAIREWAKSPSGGQKFLVDFMKGNGKVFSRFNR